MRMYKGGVHSKRTVRFCPHEYVYIWNYRLKMYALDFLQRMPDGNVNMRILSVFNYDKNT